MGKNGGTLIYCPCCQEVEICKAIPVTTITFDSSDYNQRKYFSNQDDINFFQRGRQCKSCGHEFITAEVEYEFLLELCSLRSALKDLKNNAEIYRKQTTDAQKTLEKLNKALNLLKTLE